MKFQVSLGSGGWDLHVCLFSPFVAHNSLHVVSNTVPDGFFKVTLLFAEIYDEIDASGQRVFDIYFEGLPLIKDWDIFEEAGAIDTAVTVERTVEVKDGALSILLQSNLQNCKLNGIMVVADGSVSPHYAHAVPHETPGGTYFAIAQQGQNSAPVLVNGEESHTHQPNEILVRWTWSIAPLGLSWEGIAPTITVPIGTWQLDLEVEDSGGDVEADFTTVTVQAFGFPQLSFVTPDYGDVSGGETLTLSGNFLSNVIQVKVGSKTVSPNSVSANEVEITSPSAGQPETVQISAVTSGGEESNSVPFQYIDGNLPPVAWDSGTLKSLDGPTSLAFGPDGRLYIGTQMGEVVRWTLDDNLNVIETETVVSDTIQTEEDTFRSILGVAFDPDDTSEFPCVYAT